MIRTSNIISIICKKCNFQFKIYQSIYDKFPDYYNNCNKCRKYMKKCAICGTEHNKQGETCSKECAYKLRSESWIKTCGSEHNFSKKSKSRINWENELFENEGINNVFQRDSVKEKIKKTISEKYSDKLIDNISQTSHWRKKVNEKFQNYYGVNWAFQVPKVKEQTNKSMLIKYGQLRISNGEKISAIRLSKEFRDKMENLGIWRTLETKTKQQIYNYHVSVFTRENLKKYGNVKFGENWINLFIQNHRTYSIDHSFSKYQGFHSNISPEIIGNINNLEIMTISNNSRKNKKCNLTEEQLLNKYKEFIDENKIY